MRKRPAPADTPPAPGPAAPLPRSPYTIHGHPFEMVRVPPGTFIMGSPDAEPGRFKDEAQRQVTLTRAFEVGVFPVTQALWKAVMRGNPSHFKDVVDAPMRPVERVSWFDAVRFCNAASAACGLAPATSMGGGDAPPVEGDFKAPGFRLPTEAEWENAARAGEAHRYAGSDDLDAVAWHGGSAAGSTQPVGGKRPNAWGLHDMSGNVWEWCWDWYGARLGGGVDPVGPASGSGRVYRGGCWINDPQYARVAARCSILPGRRYDLFGFRLFRTAP